jgi:hypothetical protein
MDELLNQRIRVTINGRQVVMTGREALGKQMVNRAVAGNVRMIRLLQRYESVEQASEPMIIWFEENEKYL